MKKRYYILARIAGFLMVALCSVVFLLQMPSVQTRLTKAAVSFLSKKLDADVSIGNVKLVPGSGLLITDLAIIDRTPYTADRYGKGFAPCDSFFVAGSIKARISLSGLIKGMPFRFRSVQIDDGQMCIVSEPDAAPYICNLQRIFGIPDPTVPPQQSTENIFYIKDVQINRFRFRLKNFTSLPLVLSPEGYGRNWQDLDVLTDVTAHNLRFDNGIMSGDCEHCEIWTPDGYHIHSVSGSAAVGRGKTLVNDIRIIDDWSDLKLEYFSMTYRHCLMFRQFTDSVSLGGKIIPSTLSFQTLKNIVGIMPKNTVLLNLEGGEVHGPVNNLTINSLAFHEKASGLKAKVNRITLLGLDSGQPCFTADIPAISISSQRLPGFLRRFAGTQGISLPEGIGLRLAVKGAGSLNDFDATVKIASNIGEVHSELSVLNLVKPGRKPEIEGMLTVNQVNAGSVLGIEELGKISLDTKVTAILGEKPSISIDTMNIDRLEFMGYAYHGITGNGAVKDGDLNGFIANTEKNLDLRIDLFSKGEGYAIAADVRRADLAALGLEEKTGLDKFSGKLTADIYDFEKDFKQGHINLSSLHFEKKGNASKDIDQLNADIRIDSCGTALDIASKAIRGKFRGKSIEEFDIKADLHDKDRLLSFFIPGLYVADNSTVYAQRTPSDRIMLRVVSPFVGFDKNYIKELDINLNYSDTRADFTVSAPEIGIGGTKIGKTTVHLTGDYTTDANSLTMNIVRDSSYLSVSDWRWNISNSTLELNENGIRLENFSLNSSNETGNFEIAASIDSTRILVGVSDTSPEGSLLLDAIAAISQQDSTLIARARFNDFGLNVLQPLVSGIFSETGGLLRGELQASGKLDSIQVNSNELELSDALLRVGLTNVPYILNGKLKLTDTGLSLDNIRIRDDESGRGILSGKLDFNSFRDPSLRARLSFDGLKLLGKAESGSDFYGSAYGDGDILVRGPLSDLDIDVNAATAKEGKVHVPVGSALASESQILEFKHRHDYSDEYRLTLQDKQKSDAVKTSKLNINAKVHLQENTEVLVEIDKSQGHALTVKGIGDISLNIVPSLGLIDLGGIYNITGGRYHFSALSNVATKDFTIQNGSSIKFNGKPFDSQFDISALYTRKASIEPLLVSSRSQGGLRTVECGLHIGDRISSPVLDFSINIPDLDPTTKSQVESALNTDDKVQKQFVALVLTGSFIPTEESGVTFNGGNAVFSNLSSIMSSQLNNIMQTLNIPVDMGLNYQKSNSGKDIFDVAVSTQLFHNRVILNGSVGNRANTTSSGNVVGDVDVEVKLNKSGSLRLKLFSHSPDSYTNYLDNTQRNGLGISFQSEFTYWKTLWKSIVGSKQEREQIKRSRLTRVRSFKTIQIDE